MAAPHEKQVCVIHSVSLPIATGRCWWPTPFIIAFAHWYWSRRFMMKKKPGYMVAILVATGAVGQETLEILEERKFPLAGLRLFASKRSAGEVMTCQGKEWTVDELTESSSFDGVDLAFISASDAISKV